MTTGLSVGTAAAATGRPATGSAGNGTGAGRHTSKKPRRVVRRPTRLALSNWPVSARMVAVFIAASLTGLVFGGLRVADAVGTANGYARITQLTVLGKQVTQLAQDLENERDLTVGTAAMTTLQQDATAAKAGPAVTASLQQALEGEESQLAHAQYITHTDAAPVLRLAPDLVSNSAFPASIQSSANSVLSQISDGALDAIRLAVLGQSPTVIISEYSTTLSDLFAFNDQLASSSGDPLLSNEVGALGALSRAKDQAAQQRAILYAMFIESGLNDAGGGKPAKAEPAVAPFNNVGGPAAMNDAGGLTALTTAQYLQGIDLQTFQASATQAESEAYLAAVVGPRVEFAGNIYTTLVRANGDPRTIFSQLAPFLPGFTPLTAPTTWYADQSAVVDSMRVVESRLAAQIVARSQLLQHQAFESALVTSIATVAVILLVLGATVLVGRTLVNPLRRLQADALEIAAVRLPARVAAAAAGTDGADGQPAIEPIGVQSVDEIGRVARAFDQVHAEAVRLAGTEAQLRGSLNTMFISLSRRSVPLIERLARMIDVMEQSEDDPEQLAKLFSMDHLVTRMRRNSENLLVLAGEEPVRKWTESVPLTDVARAAASEIEQYSRVALAVQPGIMISGQAAADVVHLLAELIENATLFSPQSAQVRVTVMELNSGGVLVEVRDDGVGVPPSRLADMNWRLDHPPVVDVSISRHMGLYAVARLAARHGIRVKLRPGTPQGLSALVWLPGTLAKQEQGPAAGGRPWMFGGLEATGPVMTTLRPAPARYVSGRHRTVLAGSGGQPSAAGLGAPAGQAVPAERSGAVWFAAKRPSSAAAASAEELAGGWGAADAAAAVSASLAGQAGQAGMTTAGLPRRAPRTSVHPGSEGPDAAVPFGPPGVAAPDTEGSGVTAFGVTAPVLAAPLDGMAPQGVPYQEALQREKLPSRRRSPEEVRSRLSGFQLGGRDAVQAGHPTGRGPLAGEENGR